MPSDLTPLCSVVLHLACISERLDSCTALTKKDDCSLREVLKPTNYENRKGIRSNIPNPDCPAFEAGIVAIQDRKFIILLTVIPRGIQMSFECMDVDNRIDIARLSNALLHETSDVRQQGL